MLPHRPGVLCGSYGMVQAHALANTIIAWGDELTPAQWRRIDASFANLAGELRIYVWSRVMKELRFPHDHAMAHAINRRWGNMVLEIFGGFR